MGKLIEIKDELVKEAMEITGASSEREAIERAVESYVAQHRRPKSRKSMFELVGKVRFRDDYDPRKIRFSRNDDQ